MNRRLALFIPLLLACGPYFYMAPPPLDAYPPRIAGKNWREVMAESRPPLPDAWQADVMADDCAAMIETLPDLTSAERLERIDALLVRNREGDFRLRVANLLHELREFAADDALLVAAGPYLEWRIGWLGEPAGFIGRKPQRQWDWNDEQFDEVLAEHAAREQTRLVALDAFEVELPPGLAPNLAVQRAAMWFESGWLGEAGEVFERVVGEFPDHPRAEAARLMAGRCALEQARKEARESRPNDDRSAEVQLLRDRARGLFMEYLERHPVGRFAADAHGWLAAVASDYDNPAAAVGHQLDRLSIQPTRETLRSVLRECDALFARLMEREMADLEWTVWELKFGKMAAHPEVVRLLVYQALDPVARDGARWGSECGAEERRALDFLHRRIIRAQPFARVALRELGRELVRRSGTQAADPLSLLVLAWSAVRDGDPVDALALIDLGLASSRGDELLHARAHVLGRLERHREAAAAWSVLLAEYPASPLVSNAGFERALAQLRAGEGGEALLGLFELLPPDDDQHFHEPLLTSVPHGFSELIQWIDTAAQFISMDHLKQLLQVIPAEAMDPDLLRLIRGRALAAGDFALAANCLDREELELFAGDPLISMTADEWEALIVPLWRAVETVGENPTAEGHLAAAEAWRKVRGRATLPSLDVFHYAMSEREKQDQLRRRNAAVLGLDPGVVADELDSRDELQRALVHYLAAAKLPADPAVTAAALEGANEALFDLATFSVYRASRAIETDAAGLSRQLVDRLKREFADRPEAVRAVAWKFTPPQLLEDWMPGDYSPWNSAVAIEGAIAGNGPREARNPGARDALADIRQRLDGLAAEVPEVAEDMAGLRQRVERLRADFAAVRPALSREQILAVVDDLDDLATVLTVEELTPDLFRRYAGMRLAGHPLPLPEGEWAPLAPWLDFLAIRREEAGQFPVRRNDLWLGHLMRYPDSPKAEAASLRVLRWRVRNVLPIPQVEAFHFPAAPIWNGYKRLARPQPLTVRFLDSLSQSFASASARFPGGRYAADIKLLESAVLAETGDYGGALERLVAIIDDPVRRELRLDAALQFAEIGLRLLDRDERPALAAAFRPDPAASRHLRSLVYGDTCLFLLRPLMHWLEAPDEP